MVGCDGADVCCWLPEVDRASVLALFRLAKPVLPVVSIVLVALVVLIGLVVTLTLREVVSRVEGEVTINEVATASVDVTIGTREEVEGADSGSLLKGVVDGTPTSPSFGEYRSHSPFGI